ncbi:MAG: hypothetical protein RL251_340, partial [Pseudomonadota bacterium]
FIAQRTVVRDTFFVVVRFGVDLGR